MSKLQVVAQGLHGTAWVGVNTTKAGGNENGKYFSSDLATAIRHAEHRLADDSAWMAGDRVIGIRDIQDDKIVWSKTLKVQIAPCTKRHYDPNNAKDIADFLSAAVNIMSKTETSKAVSILLNDHRTLQQAMMGFCVEYVSGMGTKTHAEIDGRNEVAAELGRKAVTAWHGPLTSRSLPTI